MKRFFCFLIAFTFSIEVLSSIAQTSKNTKRQATSKSSRKASTSNTTRRNAVASSTTKTSADTSTFETCMDNICKSDTEEEKGRCRCSSQLSRIEKVLRDIEKVQNQADEENKILETLMNVSNTTAITDAMSSVYDNINSIEKKAKTVNAQKIDATTLVMEGLPLYEESLKKCDSSLSSFSTEEKDIKIKEYSKLIESDCAAYSTILKEKADSAKNLLMQAQKNREMFDEQEYKKLNQLDNNACYVEYEACVKSECGTNFSHCKDDTNVQRALKKCQAVNYGKCEENKAVVMKDIKAYIAKELEKVKLAESCKSAYGHLINGQCLFKVLYVADKCSSGKGCGSQEEYWGTPNQSYVCEDTRGSFKDLKSGCWESCYIEGPNGEKFFKGHNQETNMVKRIGIGLLTSGISVATGNCTTSPVKFSTPAAPEGWGNDGYPLNPELRGTF